MNINCIICSDLFLPTSAIYATRCGHIFHHLCLIQWMERSKTCPQCRNKATEKSITRIYFNIPNAVGIEDDAVTLQNKLDMANLQLRLKENHIKVIEDKIKEVSDENTKLTEEIKNLKNKVTKYNSGITSLKDQLYYYKERVKRLESVETEIVTIKEKMKAIETVNKVVTCDGDEAQHIIDGCESAHTLSAISKSLKRELQIMEKKRNILFTAQKRTENELKAFKKSVTELQSENEKLKSDLKSHKLCKAEIQALNNKIAAMIGTVTPKAGDSDRRRLITESPAPMLTRPKNKRSLSDTSFEDVDSPSVSVRIKEINESDSPYLKLKASSVNIFLEKRSQLSKFGTTSSTIFKKTISDDDISSVRKPIPEGEYNGYGGHSKEDKFPSPKPLKTGIKRPKKSIVSSNKLRKLTKPTNTLTKTLDDFMDLSGMN